MNIYRYFKRALFTTAVALLTTACLDDIFPPIFSLPFIDADVLQGDDIAITATVLNGPTSVTCFDDNVVLSSTGNNQFTGTVPTALISTVGAHAVVCTAIGDTGTVTTSYGFIHVVEDVTPIVVGLTTSEATVIGGSIVVLDGDGAVSINEPLIDVAASTNLDRMTFTLDAGGDTLTNPTINLSNLSIDASTGNLVGSDVDLNTQAYLTNIIIRGESIAGVDTTQPITLHIFNNPADGSNPDMDPVADNTDCDEGDNNNHPAQIEDTADGRDNDCNGLIDEI